MREFIYTIIDMMKRILWFAVFIIVMIISTIKNIVSFDVISDYNFDQYWRNIYQFQVIDTYYKVKTSTKVFTDPVLISNLDTEDYMFYLEPNEVFAATGFYIPGNNICWIAIEGYIKETQVHGYVLEPSSCLGFFGAYINDDTQFEQFVGYEEDKYRDSLMKEFFLELTNTYQLYTANTSLEKQKFKETGEYKNISSFIKNFSGSESIYYSNNITYYCKNNQYIFISDLYDNYFATKKYLKRLTQI